MKLTQSHFLKSMIIMLVFAISFFIQPLNVSAQKIEITPFYGFQFAGKVVAYQGDLNIRDAAMYGLMLDISVQGGMQIELYYSRTDTRADFVEYRGPTHKLTDLSVNYFQLGFLRAVKNVDKITMYGIGSLGASLFSPTGQNYNETPTNYYYDDWWLFSVTVGGGAKIMFSEKIGLRLEG